MKAKSRIIAGQHSATSVQFSCRTQIGRVTHVTLNFSKLVKQELSYRQQIARQLRTQYAEGIYRHKYYTVTLKSRLRFTQNHLKRNHWIDHTRLSSSRVI